jgi:hypothetical protein
MAIPNPLTVGFRVVLRDPWLLLLEVAWRWSFGLTAGGLLWLGWVRIARVLLLSRADSHALQSHDAFLMAQAASHILVSLGMPVLRLAALLLSAISLLWILLSALGRTLVLRRLVNFLGLITEGTDSVAIRQIRFRSMLALQVWRILLAWLSLAVMMGGILVAAHIANRGSRPDYVMYYALAVPVLAAAALFWVIVNWYLSSASAWIGRQGAGAVLATRMTIGYAAARKGDVGGLNVTLTLVRVLALLLAFILCILPASMASSQGYWGWVIAIALLYFVAADLVYVARLASYLMLEEQEQQVPAEV